MFRYLLVLGLCAWAGIARADDQLHFGAVPAWVSPLEPEAPGAGSRNAAPARLLVSEMQTRFSEDGDDLFVHAAVRLQTIQGLSAGVVAMGWHPDTETPTIHFVRIRRGDEVIDVLGKGQKFTVLRREPNLEQAVIDGALTGTLQPEGLQVGDILEFAYTIRRADPVTKGHSEQIAFQNPGLAVDHFRLRAVWPKDKNIRWRQTPGLPDAVITRTEAGSELVIDARDIERPKPPQGAPARFDYLSRLELTEFADWGEVSSLMAPLYQKAASLGADSPVKAQAARIRAASSDPKAQAAAALKLVQNQVRYLFLGLDLGGYVPASADETWARRFGDCKGKTVLLLALLNELGIKAEPAFTNTRTGDGLNERLPGMQQFNHVIVRAEIGGQTYWLDGTRQGEDLMDGLEPLPYRWALPVRTAGGALEPIPTPPLDRPAATTLIRIDQRAGLNAPAPVHMELIFRGAAAEMLDAAFSARPGEAEKLAGQQAERSFPWLHLAKTQLQHDPAKREYRIVVDGAAQVMWEADEASGQMSFALGENSIGAVLDTRREPGPYADAPFAVEHPSYEEMIEEIVLPRGAEGFSVNGEAIERTAGGVAFKRKAAIADGVFRFESSRRSLQPEIPFAAASQEKLALRELWDSDVTVRSPRKYKRSEAEIQIELERQPTTAYEYAHRADIWFDRNQPDKALADLDAGVQLKPDDAFALHSRCWGRARAGRDLEAALADCNTALDIAPNRLDMLDSRALVYYRLGKYDRAIADLDRVLKQQPQVAESLYVRGLAKRAGGDARGGDDDISAARKINREVAALYAGYGVKPERR